MEQNLERLQQEIKEQYEEPHMSSEQVERLKLKMEQAKKENRRMRARTIGIKIVAAAASVAVILFVLPNTSRTVALAMQQIPLLGEFIELITVRDYQYEDERHMADIRVGELVLEDIPAVANLDIEVKKNLQRTLEEINEEMLETADWMMEDFAESVEQDVTQVLAANSSLIPTIEQYLVVKLACFAAGGSGVQWNYYYTIDLTTGKQLELADLFAEGTDFVTPISENIIAQMQTQMAEDSMKVYWLDSDIEEWNFKRISEETSFYVNEAGNIVICFDEGDVAPMYMGALEFEIDNEVIRDIRK